PDVPGGVLSGDNPSTLTGATICAAFDGSTTPGPASTRYGCIAMESVGSGDALACCVRTSVAATTSDESEIDGGMLNDRYARVPGSPPTVSVPGGGGGVPFTTIVKSATLCAIETLSTGVSEYGAITTGATLVSFEIRIESRDENPDSPDNTRNSTDFDAETCSPNRNRARASALARTNAVGSCIRIESTMVPGANCCDVMRRDGSGRRVVDGRSVVDVIH